MAADGEGQPPPSENGNVEKDEGHEQENGQQNEEMMRAFACKICFEPFSKKLRCPITLNCGHTFCRQCTSHLAKSRNSVQCGICRKTTYSDWMKLGKNIEMTELLEWAKFLGKDEDSEPAEGEQIEGHQQYDGAAAFIVRADLEDFLDELALLDNLCRRLPKKGRQILLQQNTQLTDSLYVVEQQLRLSSEAFNELREHLSQHHQKVVQMSIGQVEERGMGIWEEADEEEESRRERPFVGRFFGEFVNEGFGTMRRSNGRGGLSIGRAMGSRGVFRRQFANNAGPSSSAFNNLWSEDEEDDAHIQLASVTPPPVPQEESAESTPSTPEANFAANEAPENPPLVPPPNEHNTNVANPPPPQQIVPFNAPENEEAFGNSGFANTGSNAENEWGFGNGRRSAFSSSHFGRSTSWGSSFGAGSSNGNRRRRNRNCWRPPVPVELAQRSTYRPNPIPEGEWESSSDGWSDGEDRLENAQQGEAENAQQQNENVEGNLANEIISWDPSQWRGESLPRVLDDSEPDYNSLLGWESGEEEEMEENGNGEMGEGGNEELERQIENEENGEREAENGEEEVNGDAENERNEELKEEEEGNGMEGMENEEANAEDGIGQQIEGKNGVVEKEDEEEEEGGTKGEMEADERIEGGEFGGNGAEMEENQMEERTNGNEECGQENEEMGEQKEEGEMGEQQQNEMGIGEEKENENEEGQKEEGGEEAKKKEKTTLMLGNRKIEVKLPNE